MSLCYAQAVSHFDGYSIQFNISLDFLAMVVIVTEGIENLGQAEMRQAAHGFLRCLAKVLKRNFRIFEVPITFNPRDYAQGKKIKLHDAFEAVWTLIKYRFVE